MYYFGFLYKFCVPTFLIYYVLLPLINLCMQRAYRHDIQKLIKKSWVISDEDVEVQEYLQTAQFIFGF